MFLMWEPDVSFSYLFWVQQGRGVHRVDLADFKLPRERAVQRILTLDLVSSIAIDYLRYRMFFPNESSNTMMSSALDGTDVIDIRHNTQNPDFINVKSLTCHQVAALSVFVIDRECILYCPCSSLTLTLSVKVLQWQTQLFGVAYHSVCDQLEHWWHSGNNSELICFACITCLDGMGFYFIALLCFKLFCLKLYFYTVM